ncbi:MAG: HAD family hydrolase [Deltaproteobacteria bacterium]|nr:MAG: HAD family hydrolase [Deltaproteobacteria bacterium]
MASGVSRRYDLVVFDLDGTLVVHDGPVWKTLHGALGSDPARRKEVVRRALAGEISYADWFAADLAMLEAAGADRDALMAVVATFHPAPGALELLRRLKAAGAHTAILSGGVDLVVERHLPADLIDAVWVNRIFFDAGGRISGGEATPYDREHKAAGVRELRRRFGVPKERVAFVGNGPNDVAAAHEAAFAVAWNDAPEDLRAASDVYLPGPDLLAAEPYLLA